MVLKETNIQEPLTRKVLMDYEELLQKSYSLIDENQVQRIMMNILNAQRVYFYGIGSSGLVAKEMKSRFTRLGLFCDAITDQDLMRMNSALLDENCLVILLSISGETPAIISAIEHCRKRNANIVLYTANKNLYLESLCDELVIVATAKNLSYGNRVSPQLPLLVMVDLVYAYFLNSDIDMRSSHLTTTLEALDD